MIYVPHRQIAARSDTGGVVFHSINLTPDELALGDPGPLLVERVESLGARLLAGQVFGRPSGAVEPVPGIDWLAGTRCVPGKIHGARALAVVAPRMKAIRHDGNLVGWNFEDDMTRYGYFFGVRPGCGPGVAPAVQAGVWFDGIEAILASGGYSFTDVARTWFWLDRVLDWYVGFNHARNAFFRKVFGTGGAVPRKAFLPGSTAVGAANPSGLALTADVLCVRSRGHAAAFEEAVSPQQCPATDYRSAFSRAVEIPGSAGRWLTVSGTASIGPDGQTWHHGNADAQVERAMAVVEALLRERRCNWGSVWRGVAYLSHPAVGDALDRWLATHRPGTMPLTRAVCEVCRNALCFEIEVDAMAQGEEGGGKR